ncbi:MAG TPA: SLC13 family permease [Hyphomonadaceae bacterium]|nr:SLC13 family permease [Hyphomonadaceae bacterium]
MIAAFLHSMEPWLDLGLITALIAVLVSGRVAPSTAFMAFIAAVVALGRLPFSQVLGLAVQPATVAVLALVVFAGVLSRLAWLRRITASRHKTGQRAALFRFLSVAGAISAFAPNTAVVGAMMGPATRNPHVDKALLLLPLSYVALAGGVITPFGTSTNVMVTGEAAKAGLTLTVIDYAPIGIFALIAVLIALLVFAPLTLKRAAQDQEASLLGFHLEAHVPPGSKLIGKTVTENGLRALAGLYLAEIIRTHEVLAPVEPGDRIEQGDVLIFVGDVSRLDDLAAIDGLQLDRGPRANSPEKIYQAVVSANSVLVGRTLKEVGFRARFDASALAIRRGEERLSGKLGAQPLRAGDMLVLAAGADFVARDNVRSNFHLVDADFEVGGRLNRRDGALVTAAFVAFIIASLSGIVDFTLAAFALAAGSIALGWISPREAKRSFPFELAISLWGSVTLAHLIRAAGFDALVADALISVTGTGSMILALIAVYFATWLLTELVSNVSAALAALPVALEVAAKIGADPEPFALAAAFAASASFLVPFGYQTHLMVMSAGPYRFLDYVRLGAIVFAAYSAAILGGLFVFWM